MDKKFNNEQNANPTTSIDLKNEIGLPLIAISLDLLPLLILSSLLQELPSFILMLIPLSPIAGLTMGVVSLNQVRICILGKVLAIIAIALPLALVALILMFFIGAATGVISLM